MGAGFKIKQTGFTIIELLVVIVVIGILVSIITISYDSIQRDVRDNERAADIELITSALENYYNQNGKYPPISNTDFSAFIANSGLNRTALAAPGTSSGTVSFMIDPSVLNPVAPNYDQYFYRSYKGTANNLSNLCKNTTDTCRSFEIIWRKEKDGNIQFTRSQYGW